MRDCLSTRGFLPCEDPDGALTLNDELALLDRLGEDLPSLLLEAECRDYLRHQAIPEWPFGNIPAGTEGQARLYYLRLGFLAAGYLHQIGQPVLHSLPANLARPLWQISQLLQRPPILSYDGYVLYNWKRFDPQQPVRLGNIATLQNFVHLDDEHWFMLVQVESEIWAADMLAAIEQLARQNGFAERGRVDAALARIEAALVQLIRVSERLPERMSDDLYFNHFHPYVGEFKAVIYEGVAREPYSYHGPTSAQSTLLPTLTALLKVPHPPNRLTQHLQAMRRYMPASHRAWLEWVEQLPDLKAVATPELFDRVLELLAHCRELQYHWHIKYIARRCLDPQGTEGMPYMKFMRYLVDETRQHKIGGAESACG